jgi:hypothetical protein
VSNSAIRILDIDGGDQIRVESVGDVRVGSSSEDPAQNSSIIEKGLVDAKPLIFPAARAVAGDNFNQLTTVKSVASTVSVTPIIDPALVCRT